MSVSNPTVAASSAGDSKEEMGTSLVYQSSDFNALGRLDLFSIAFNVVSVVPSVASVLMFSLPGGGTHGITWAWLVCAGFVTVIALAVMQLLGASPPSGGVYKRADSLPPSRSRSVFSWVVGCANIIGNVASVASICWAIASDIMAVAFVGSGFVGTRAETFGVYCALLLLQGIVRALSPTTNHGLSRLFMLGNILLWVAIVAALPAASPKPLNTPKFVFGTFTNVNKAWENNVFAFLLTFVGPFWALGRATATVHMADMAKKPRNDVAFAVVGGTFANAIMALALNIALGFSMGNNLRAIVNDSHGQPMSTILLHAFGRKGTIVTYAFMILLQLNAGATMLSATSSHATTFLHNGGLFFDTVVASAKVFGVRESSAVAYCSLLVSALLGLLALAGTGAINSLFSTAVVGNLFAFTLAIVVGKFRGRPQDKPADKSVLSLGVLDSPISFIAMIIMTVLSVFFLFPESQHPSAGDVNYAVVIVGAVMITSGVFFFRITKGKPVMARPNTDSRGHWKRRPYELHAKP